MRVLDKGCIPNTGLRWHNTKNLNVSCFFLPKNSYKLTNKIKALSNILNIDVNKIQQELFRKYFTLNDHQKIDLFTNPSENRKTIFDYDFKDFKEDLSIPLCIDYSKYLKNDILTKVDRATMSVSLEGREPFIDHRIIEFVARLPMKFKYGNTQKQILKDIVYKYVPSELMDRPKSGFSIPIN